MPQLIAPRAAIFCPSPLTSFPLFAYANVQQLLAPDRGHRVVSMNIAVCKSSPLELAPLTALFSLRATSSSASCALGSAKAALAFRSRRAMRSCVSRRGDSPPANRQGILVAGKVLRALEAQCSVEEAVPPRKLAPRSWGSV